MCRKLRRHRFFCRLLLLGAALFLSGVRAGIGQDALVFGSLKTLPGQVLSGFLEVPSGEGGKFGPSTEMIVMKMLKVQRIEQRGDETRRQPVPHLQPTRIQLIHRAEALALHHRGELRRPRLRQCHRCRPAHFAVFLEAAGKK